MVRLRLLVMLLLGVMTFAACLDRGEAHHDPMQAPSFAAVTPASHDIELCQQLAKRERSCFSDLPSASTQAIEACAARFACSRRMWRPEMVDAVYKCMGKRDCDDADPAMSCLEKAALAIQPSLAETAFEHALEEAERECPNVIDVAPGQSDAVYQALMPCLQDAISCNERTSCSARALQQLLRQTCRRHDNTPSRATTADRAASW